MQENEKECQVWNVAGSHEVRGSIPRSSTNFPLNNKASAREAPLLPKGFRDKRTLRQPEGTVVALPFAL